MRELVNSPGGFAIGLAFLAILQTIVFLLTRDGVRGSKQRDLLKSRLAGYTFLKANEADREASKKYTSSYCSDGVCLSCAEWEVLLGTLKKVEAKNAVLATLLVFLLSISLSSLLSTTSNDGSNWNGLLLLIVSALIFPAILVIRGIRQVDQRDFGTNVLCRECAAKKLQNSLVNDLLQKETAFRFSGFFVSGIIPAILFFVYIEGLEMLVPPSAP